ncbi:hypothetical protein BC834DRAFT_575094 [Gloeopeniophorella convolvens]|nr:hypothetical protein BC834DRAFT_575094 [Gloeopeniophorella convolvens]
MRPKQLLKRTVAPLPIERVGVNPARAAGPSRAHKSSAVREKPKVVLHLPLEECAVGSTILSSGDVSEAQMGFFWEREDKRIKLRTGQGDIRLELVYGHRSLRVVEHVDEKDPGARPLIKISPLLNTAVDFPSPYNFKIGAPYPCGDLIFKFDATSKDWDLFVYETLVQDLVNCLTALNNRSILGQPAAKSLWEGVMNVQNLPMDVSEPEVDSLWVQQQAPRQPSKPKPRPEPRTEVSPNLYVRRSARLSGAETKRFSPRPDPDEVILCYRSGTGSLNITNGDVGRLKPGEFLNDTLIEFGLKLWLADLQQTDPELAAQIHVFSSFFYKKLSTKNQGYDSVRKWTSKFDLFQKKYVIVPINENLHWYLAIIYLPEYTLLPRPAEEAVTAPRRSTRRLGVVMDSSDAHPSNMDVDMDVDPPLSDPDPPLPPRSRSASFVPESPRTDDLKDESAVERLVKVSDISIDSPLKPEETLVAIGVIDQVEFDPEQHELGYPASDPPDGVHEQRDPSTSGTPGTSGTKSDGDSTPPIRTSGISPSNFYGTKESRRRNSIAPRSTAPVDGPPIEIEIGENETLDSPDSDVEDGSTEHPKTYIYTFDSLSSKHTSAIKKLSQYLLYEARDKKGKAEDTLTLSKGMQAIVPHQPNYCDCGIYLLHFAKTFMKDPKLSSDIIRNPQKGRRVHEHWDGASVGGAREELTARIMSMSEEWKKSRDTQEAAQKNQVDAAVPQEQNSGNATPAISANADGDSDSDIEVLVAPKKSAPASKVSRRGNGTTEPRKRGPATRVRG